MRRVLFAAVALVETMLAVTASARTPSEKAWKLPDVEEVAAGH